MNSKKEKTKIDYVSQFLLFFIIISLVVRAFILNWFFVPSDSMYPGISRNTFIFSNCLAYGVRIPFTNSFVTKWDNPKKGEVVILQNPKDTNETLVKRIMGTEGDTVIFRGGKVSINGEEASYQLLNSKNINFQPNVKQEAYLEKWKNGQQEVILKTLDKLDYVKGANSGRDAGKFVIPKGFILAIGDNRDNSFDSRFKDIGLIPVDNVKGRVIGHN